RATDALIEGAAADQAPDREPADRHDQFRPEQAQLPLEPERAQLLLARRRHPVAGARRRAAGVAPGDGGAVERRVEGVVVEVEPAAQVLAGAAAPRSPLLALEHAGRLAVHVGALSLVALEHRQ